MDNDDETPKNKEPGRVLTPEEYIEKYGHDRFQGYLDAIASVVRNLDKIKGGNGEYGLFIENSPNIVKTKMKRYLEEQKTFLEHNGRELNP